MRLLKKKKKSTQLKETLVYKQTCFVVRFEFGSWAHSLQGEIRIAVNRMKCQTLDEEWDDDCVSP